MAIVYNTSIARNGLVLHLDAANVKSYPGSGTTWFDLSGNNNNATKNGTSSLANWNASGFFEHRPSNVYGAVDISSTAPDSGGCWWTVNHTSSLNPNAGFWSVCGWLKIIGNQSGNGSGWFHKSGSGDERGIHLEPINNQFRANGSNGWQQITPAININSIWAYYSWVFTQTSGTYQTDAGNLKLYINDVLISEDTDFRPAIDAGAQIYLGRRNGHLRHFLNADIASYQYYTKSLTANEVRQNFEAQRSRYGL